VTLAPTSTNGVMRADDALERLSFVHLYTVSPDRMRQNESVGLNSFRIEISAIFVRRAKSSRRTANASARSARQRQITEFFPSCAAWEPAGLLASARAPARSEHPVAGACGQEPTTGN
jgi:hypothetical protein